jgi:hypothetical protein
MNAGERRSAFTRVSFNRKAFAANCLYAFRIKARDRSAFDEFHDQVVDAVHAFESIESVGAVRYDDVKTVAQSLRDAFTIRWRRNRIPLTS